MIEATPVAPGLESLQKTLLLPLWGRAEASRMQSPVLTDLRAVELIGRMDYDFSRLSRQLGTFCALSLAARAKEFDAVLLDFVKRKGNVTAVNLGAGLDTAFCRVKSERLRWVDIDLPDVIALRRKLLPETREMEEIPKSMFDGSIRGDIGEAENVLFIIGGVLMYFGEARVRQLFEQLSGQFRNAEMVFDTFTPLGVLYCNRRLAKSGFHNAGMKWGIRNPGRMERWSPRLKIVRHFSVYANIRPQRSYPLQTRVMIRLARLLRPASIVHLEIR